MGMSVTISDQITAEVSVGAIGAALALAEGYQESGRLDEAIGLIKQLADANRRMFRQHRVARRAPDPRRDTGRACPGGHRFVPSPSSPLVP